MKVNNSLWQKITKNKRPEYFFFILFILLLLFTYYFHTPWFDEVQSWLIAKQASLKDILFLIPHYEGHPPFFHLLLAGPAKLGLPWQIGLQGFISLFTIISAWLIIFKAPFSRAVRLSLPFSYFLFYQYGVICRPYNIMMLIILLLAVAFPKKDEKPYLFTALLAALCACHIYGIAIACGITLAWLWEMKKDLSFTSYLRNLLRDKRFHSMLCLLVWALLLCYLAMPKTDTYALSNHSKIQGSFIQQILYLIFIMPSDAVLTSIYDTPNPLSFLTFSPMEILSGILTGSIIWFICLKITDKKFWPYLFMPYIMFIIPMAFYCSRHHIGIVLLIFIFALWVSWQKNPKKIDPFAKFIIFISLFVSINWSLANIYFNTLPNPYTMENFANFLKQTNFENKKILAAWKFMTAKDFSWIKNLPDDFYLEDTNHMFLATQISLYNGHNIFTNLNNGENFTYMTHITPSDEINAANLSLWHKYGLPEITVGTIFLERIFPEQDYSNQYILTGIIRIKDIWKFDQPLYNDFPIYIHKDLLNSYNAEHKNKILPFKE